MANILDQLGQALGIPAVQEPVANAVRPSKGERNRNPGNLEDGPFARSQPGYKGTDGRFAIFETAQHGEAAQVKLLTEGKRYKGKSPAGIIQTYAPRADNSEESMRNYIGYAAARAGVDPDKPIPKEKAAAFAAGMREFETGKRAQGVKFTPYSGRIEGSKMSGAAGGYNSSSPGRGVADPSKFLDGLQSSLSPETMNSDGVKQNASATFGSDKELASRGAAVEGQLQVQGQQIDVLDQALQVAQSGAREAMTRQIDQTRDVSNEIVEGTKQLKDKVMPVFKARSRVADQLDKLTTMNPLERGIRGIFDLNYDQKFLEGQLDDFDRTLKSRADDFDYINKLHGVALQEISRRYTMDTAIPELMAKQAEEDLGITGMRMTQTAGMLGSLRDRISTETQVISAKALAREDLLGRLDLPTVANLTVAAQQNNGIVNYNGVEFSYKELRDRTQAAEQQDLQVEAFKMSIASNRMDMAEKYATNIARSLTRGQLEGAINNGGIYNGIQLPQDVLTSSYQSALARDGMKAESIATNMPAALALQTGTDSLRMATGLARRAQGLFGNTAMQGGENYLNRSSQLVRELVKATESGQPPEVITALTQQIAKNSEAYQGFVDERILRQVGGDKRAAGYMKGFVYGAQLSPGTAAEAITYFALKGNLPEGVSLSAESKQVFQKAQSLVQAHREDRVNGKPISESALQSLVTRELTDSATKIMGQARHDKLYADLPNVAKASNHPMGRFDPQRWSEIRAEASMTAAESIAKGLNTTPQNVLQMLRTGKPLTNDQAGKDLLAKAQAAAPQFNGVEMQTTVSLIDMEKQVNAGTRNSTVLGDFLGSPAFSQGLDTYGKSLGSQTMGEYLVNPMISGAVEKNFGETRQSVLDSQAQIHQTQRQLAQNPQTSMLLRPVTRTKMILQAIPGVSNEGAKALEPFVSKFFEGYMKNNFSNGIESPNSRFVREDSALRDALQNAQFPDKRLDGYRKLAVNGWQEHATQQQGWIQRTVDALFGDSF